MKLRMKKADLLRGLRLAAGVADRKATLPILGSALLRASKGSLYVGATDLSVSVIAGLPAEVQADGAVAIPAKHAFEIVRELPGEEVAFEADEKLYRATIRAGRAEFTVPGLSAKDYPKMPEVGEPGTKVDATILRDMMARTAFSIASDDTRQHLASLLFECHGGAAVMVSTDGHRLSKAGRDLPGAPDFPSILIPRKGVAEILRVLEGREAPVGISVVGGTFAVRADDVGIWATLTDGLFPPWEQVVPKDGGRGAVVVRTALMEALSRVSIMTGKDSGVMLTLAKGLLRIEAKDPDEGDAKEEIEAEARGGEIKVGANASYLRDWLGAASSEKVKIELPGELDPIVLRPEDGTDYVGVVMPLRI